MGSSIAGYLLAGVLSIGAFGVVLWAFYKLGKTRSELEEVESLNEKAGELIADMAQHLEEKEAQLLETEERLIEELVAHGDIESVVDELNQLFQNTDSDSKLPN